MNSALATCELLWKAWFEHAFVGSCRHAMGVRAYGEPGLFFVRHTCRGLDWRNGPSLHPRGADPSAGDPGHFMPVADLARLKLQWRRKP